MERYQLLLWSVREHILGRGGGIVEHLVCWVNLTGVEISRKCICAMWSCRWQLGYSA